MMLLMATSNPHVDGDSFDGMSANELPHALIKGYDVLLVMRDVVLLVADDVVVSATDSGTDGRRDAPDGWYDTPD